MTRTTACTTENVSREILLFRAFVFAVTDFTTILAKLVFVVTKSTVQRSEFSKLIALVIVLTFRRGCSLTMNRLSIRKITVKIKLYIPFR